MNNKELKIKKVVYFDEGSATDYIQIIRGGALEETTKLIKETNKNIEAGGKASVSPISSLLSTVIGIGVNIDGGYQKKKYDMASSIISNTILTDFIILANESDDEIFIKSNVELIEPVGSLTEFLKISAYTNMITGSQGLDEQFELNISKFDDTLKQAKDYFEFQENNSNNKKVFRFNIDALRNNYRSTDLTKMRLTLYSILVGDIKESELRFTEDLNSSFKNNDLNKPKYSESSEKKESEEGSFELYDVILAGVE